MSRKNGGGEILTVDAEGKIKIVEVVSKMLEKNGSFE